MSSYWLTSKITFLSLHSGDTVSLKIGRLEEEFGSNPSETNWMVVANVVVVVVVWCGTWCLWCLQQDILNLL